VNCVKLGEEVRPLPEQMIERRARAGNPSREARGKSAAIRL
jgi:hypothetical protein